MTDPADELTTCPKTPGRWGTSLPCVLFVRSAREEYLN
jgi:hypothetical protein